MNIIYAALLILMVDSFHKRKGFLDKAQPAAVIILLVILLALSLLETLSRSK